MKKNNLVPPAQAISFIRRHRLAPVAHRSINLITISYWFYAYHCLLKKEIGFNYDVSGGIGDDDTWDTLLDEESLMRKARRQMFRDSRWIHHVVRLADRICREAIMALRVTEGSARKAPWHVLHIVDRWWPRYFTGLGIYNVLLRSIANDHSLAAPRILSGIAKKRDAVAHVYPEVQSKLRQAAVCIGNSLGFDGTLIMSMTRHELSELLSRKKPDTIPFDELKRRRAGYVIIFKGKQNQILTNPKVVQKVRAFISRAPTGMRVVKGFPVYPGKIRGIACRSIQMLHRFANKHPIYVTHMTHPKETPYLSNVSALVTDEGGLLCHAAVVAREFKIPCVVSTKIATKIFKDGDQVEVDATKGIVRKLK